MKDTYKPRSTQGFIGFIGYLADDVPGVRLLLGVLSTITGNAVPSQ
jgi:hypothetical protein